MIQTLIKNWWLLGLRALLAMVFSVMAFMMQSSAEDFTLRDFALKGMVVFLGMLAVTAGVCTVAAGIWRASAGKWWLLVVDGVIVSTAGFVLILARNFSFRELMYVVVALAAAIGVVEIAAARALRRHLRDEWLLDLAGMVSVAFALAFLVIKLKAGPMFIWLGSYSGFSAICMLALALRLRGLRVSIHNMARSVSQQ
jgi:uncharacterized membrane protein HdeD (DUF308 family)